MLRSLVEVLFFLIKLSICLFEKFQVENFYFVMQRIFREIAFNIYLENIFKH